MKRAFDVAISLVALVLLAPLFGLIAIAIKRDSPGPVIYRGTRVGRGGRLFKILKFRTMYETPESYAGPRLTARDDPRVTRLGHWLRDTKLNELPQFWNVLVGEMSLVGPRPEDPALEQRSPKAVRDAILSVRPGITSPASVIYHNEEALLGSADGLRKYVDELCPDKTRLDRLYVQNRSFYGDLDTLLWTALIMAPKISSYRPPESLLFVGPITRLGRRVVNWFVADLLVTLAAIGCTGLFWRTFGALNIGLPRSIAAAAALALLFSVMGAVLGVNRIDWSKASPQDVYDLLIAWAVSATTAFAANELAGLFPAGLVVTASILALCGFVAIRYQERLATSLVNYLVRHRVAVRSDRQRVLIVGSDHNAQHAAWLLHQPGNAQKFQVFGFVDDDLSAQGNRIHGASIVGTCSDIPKLVAQHGIGMIVLADHPISSAQYRAIAEVCRNTKTKLMHVPDVASLLQESDGAEFP